MTWGRCGDDGDNVGTTWGPQGLRGQHGVETMETTAMGTTWGPPGGYGDDGDDTGTMWGSRGTKKSLKMQ